MPRKSINTERGSQVQRKKRKQESLYDAALHEKSARPSSSLASIAQRQHLCARELQRRWRRYQAAARDGDPAPFTVAAADRRGGHNRAFTRPQEQLLAEIVLAAPTAMTHPQIQRAALELHRDAHVALHHSRRSTRRDVAFKASARFVTQFKRRNRLSSHRSSLKFLSQTAADALEQEHTILEYVNHVRTAVDTYGGDRVFNMDETPVPKCDYPITGVVATRNGRAAHVRTTSGNRLNVTHFPTITASGRHLQLCAIIKGKTERSLKKIKTGASAAVQSVRLYTSLKGWTNSSIMIQYFRDVLQPWLAGRPGALVMDDYHAHWTNEVRAAAAAMDLQLIKVPPGRTYEYQPLDVCFNGPMTKARQRIWLEERILNPEQKDSEQKAVERCQMAYDSICRQSTIDAWRKAFLVD